MPLTAYLTSISSSQYGQDGAHADAENAQDVEGTKVNYTAVEGFILFDNIAAAIALGVVVSLHCIAKLITQFYLFYLTISRRKTTIL